MAWPSEIKAAGGGVFGAVARVLYALYTYGEQLYNALTAGGPHAQILTLSATINNGATATLDTFEYTSGTAYSTLTTKNCRRITLVNTSGATVTFYGAGLGDVGVELRDLCTVTMNVSDPAAITVANNSGGSVTIYAVLEGTFAAAGA